MMDLLLIGATRFLVGGTPHWVGAEPSRTVWPQLRPKSYRFKVRAELDGAFRDWSGWATFRLE